MIKSLLVLVTNYFPFYKGEDYIETEIKIASNYFDKIIIIPTMRTISMKQTRVIPDNVEVLDINVDCSLFGKGILVLKGLKGILLHNDFKNLKTESGNSLKRLMYNLYFKARVWAVYNMIIQKKEFYDIVSNQPNIILYSSWLHVTASIVARIKKYYFHNGVTAISRGHRYDIYDYAAPCGYVPDRNFMLNEMNMVFPCSDDGTNYLKNKFPFFKSKFKTARIGSISHSPIVCKRDPIFIIVSCSAVRPVKRLDKIIDVVQAVSRKGYKIKWIHLGGGERLGEIQNLAAQKLDIEEYEFLGQMKNQDIYSWYIKHNVSCFINLSDSEGVPLAIMEAMCFGIPAVVTDVGGSKEIIESGSSGFVVGKEDTVELIANIIEQIILLSDQDYALLCNNSYKVWCDRCDSVKLYNQFYQEIFTLV